MSNNVIKKKDWEYPKLKTSILLDTRVREHLDEENRLTNIPVSKIIVLVQRELEFSMF